MLFNHIHCSISKCFISYYDYDWKSYLAESYCQAAVSLKLANCAFRGVKLFWVTFSYVTCVHISDEADAVNPQNISVTENVDLLNSMWIQWTDPPTPNGLIVLYDVELSRVEVSNVSSCIRYVIF